jgi:hypothetical protein
MTWVTNLNPGDRISLNGTELSFRSESKDTGKKVRVYVHKPTDIVVTDSRGRERVRVLATEMHRKERVPVPKDELQLESTNS